MMITANTEVAAFVEEHGVHRIFMDQEVLGKHKRQGHLDTHQAAHSLSEISAVAAVLHRSELMVRVNPLNDRTKLELDGVIAAGAQRVMLPMFTSRHEVSRFLDLVNGRVPVTFLAETPQALVRLSDWLPLLSVSRGDEVHIGLNDLSLGLGLGFLFEPLGARLLDPSAELLNATNITWGIGGIARIGEGDLPSEMVLGEHVRLNSQWAILSRAFHRGAASLIELLSGLDFLLEIKKLREIEAYWRQVGNDVLLNNQKKLAEIAFLLGRKNS